MVGSCQKLDVSIPSRKTAPLRNRRLMDDATETEEIVDTDAGMETSLVYDKVTSHGALSR